MSTTTALNCLGLLCLTSNFITMDPLFAMILNVVGLLSFSSVLLLQLRSFE